MFSVPPPVLGQLLEMAVMKATCTQPLCFRLCWRRANSDNASNCPRRVGQNKKDQTQTSSSSQKPRMACCASGLGILGIAGNDWELEIKRFMAHHGLEMLGSIVGFLGSMRIHRQTWTWNQAEDTSFGGAPFFSRLRQTSDETK